MKNIIAKNPERITQKVKIKFKKKDGKSIEMDATKIITKPVKIKFNEQPKKEKVPLFIVYKEDGMIKTEVTDDICDYELFGFLKLFIRRMGKLLEGDMEEREDLGWEKN